MAEATLLRPQNCLRCKEAFLGTTTRGLAAYCKTCRSLLNQQYRQKNGAVYNATRRSKHANDPRLEILKSARYRAKRGGLSFNLTLEDVVIPKFCPVLGMELKVASGLSAPTLDRLHNYMGYVKGNVSVISWRANRLKSDASV